VNRKQGPFPEVNRDSGLYFRNRAGGESPCPEEIALIEGCTFQKTTCSKRSQGTGHIECLRRIADTFGDSLRQKSDLLARFDGEEFVVVLPGVALQTEVLLAERMRKAVWDLSIPHSTSPTAQLVTVSAGVSAEQMSVGVQKILNSADVALYRAKSAGRNCVR
jgi:hypothetical protein